MGMRGWLFRLLVPAAGGDGLVLVGALLAAGFPVFKATGIGGLEGTELKGLLGSVGTALGGPSPSCRATPVAARSGRR
jgi:hypothetical protein